jgi:hypothetical protein
MMVGGAVVAKPEAARAGLGARGRQISHDGLLKIVVNLVQQGQMDRFS